MNYYSKIKKELLNYEIIKKVKEYSVNKSELQAKYNVGKMLIEAQGGEARAKYGNGLIKEYSEKLYKETGLKYSTTSLKYMRQFYLFQKGQSLPDQLTWSHIMVLLPISDNSKIKYYIDLCCKQHLSYRQLALKIKQNEYERLPQSTKDKLLNGETNYEITDFVKNPIIVKNPMNASEDEIKEKILQQIILEDIQGFLLQLGEGFCFIASEYKIKIGNDYNYIDILLFNYIYNAFVVVELKTTKLQKEHIGQVEVYMNYIDKNIKKISHGKTIGLIISKKGDSFIIEYSSDKRIYNITYVLEKN